MAEIKSSSDVYKKVIRLFSYLEKALALDDNIVRDFRLTSIAPSPWWIADLPNDIDSLRIRAFNTETAVEDENSDSAWIRVEKKNIAPTPELPEALLEWVSDITPLESPKPKEKIDREILFSKNEELVKEFKNFKKNFKQGDKPPKSLKDWVVLKPDSFPEALTSKYESDYWKDHPELHKLLDGYTNNKWKPWAEKVDKIYRANLFYDQMYALRLLLKNEGDSYELLLGQGLLTWKHDAAGSIFAPVFITPLTLDFDASKRVIEITPDPMYKGFTEISFLHGLENPAEMDLITWSDKINSNPFDFWHLETLKSQAQTLVNYVSTESEERFEATPSSVPELTKSPSIWNSPVIFARKRTNDLWSKYAGFIRRDIEKNEVKLTQFISDLVGDYVEEGNENEVEVEEVEHSISEAELFFPLPWNDEQKRIAERLDANYGVVVKGPPGTGKSHTIANLISRCLAQGKTVLVTSQTSKALDVLRDKLPENIRSLAVSQLNQSARKDDVLQQSISEISSNLGERHTKFSEDKTKLIRNELQRVREEKATLASKIRKFILTDSQAKITIDGEDIKPIDAAKLVDKYQNSDDLAWFTDKVLYDTELNFTEDDLTEGYRLLKELSKEERLLYEFELPEISVLPKDETVVGAFSTFKELSAKAKTSNNFFHKSNPGFAHEELTKIWGLIQETIKVHEGINKDYEQEIYDLCSISKNELNKWRTTLDKINDRLEKIASCQQEILGHDIKGKVDLTFNQLKDAVSVLKKKVADGSRIGTFTKILLPSQAKKVVDTYLIDGYSPDDKDKIHLLDQYLSLEQAKNDIQLLLEQGFSQLKNSPDFDLEDFNFVQIEVLVSNLDRLVNYSSKYSEIDVFCKKTNELSELNYTKRSDLDKVSAIISSSVAQFELENMEDLFTRWIEAIEDSVNGKYYSVVNELLEAINKRSAPAWRTALGKLILMFDQKKKATRLDDIALRIRETAPNLYSEIVGLADQNEKFLCPDNLQLVWKVARLKSWLDKIHADINIDELQKKLDRLTKKEQQLNSELVTILAWQRQIDKVTKRQSDALMAWSLAMKKYGKGTGKYATTHLRSAQDALREAKDAVPVWIMPLHRVAQMFPEPKAGMFDVVIFDEASQCDIKGLTVGYLGKKLLVVGDPEQISPAGVFQNQEKIFELTSRYLHDIPFKESFSVTSSLFDLAKIRLSNIIQLNEHFRCVPDIIAFSNHHIYEGKLQPLRYPHPKGLLKPALVPVYIEGGYQNKNNKVNEPEAEQLVKKLVELLNDPRYQTRPDGKPCTFGIVSLLAVDQAKYIEQLISGLVAKGEISEQTIEERKIECGDAYKFQGDERDVMLLSMVRAHDPDKLDERIAPLTKEDAKRRFNVAASRAKDQMFLFHSLPLESFLNKNDWRYKLLSWFYDPQKEELKAGREVLKKEFESGNASQFSFDVGNILIDRGYQVLPEYPAIGYRIDLVVQGSEARLAIECDGDQYHTLENWEADQARENQLRRAGWEFWRVTGSSFYRHKETALDSLWEKLDEMGIEPIVEK
jgi:hypothetical protein